MDVTAETVAPAGGSMPADDIDGGVVSDNGTAVLSQARRSA